MMIQGVLGPIDTAELGHLCRLVHAHEFRRPLL